MAIALKNNSVIAPFMGDTRMLSVGLNPLGIRTASEQLFTTLLPGMNVVTLRVRYYSFYCWLIKRFYETRPEGENDSLWMDFRKYIRVSEFLMACIHAASDNSLGIPGITEAQNIVNAGSESIDLFASALPDGKISGGYWKGSMGALGTYYLASMQEIGLALPLQKDERLYNVTPRNDEYISGEELAEAFADSIGNEMALLFETCAQRGYVTGSELAEMADVFQSHNLKDGQERDLLVKLLLQKDKPRSHSDGYLRKDTLRLFLRYIQDNENARFSELEFARYIYSLYHAGKERSTAAAGWYAYYLNDNRQFEALNIFSEVLKRLRDSKASGGWEKIDDFAHRLAEEAYDEFDIDASKLHELFENWNDIVEPTGTTAHAFYILFGDYVSNKNYKECQKIMKLFFHDVRHDAMEQFDEIENMLEMHPKDFMQTYIVESIIYRHYSEATRKFSQNGVPTQKLTIENGLVRGLAGFWSSHSSPRIDTLRNFATDLGLIASNKITTEGANLLILLTDDTAN